MSDLMVLGVLRMPVTPQSDELTLMQYIDRGRQAADLIESQQQRIAELEQREVELAAHVDLPTNKGRSACAAPYNPENPNVKTKGQYIYNLGEIVDEYINQHYPDKE